MTTSERARNAFLHQPTTRRRALKAGAVAAGSLGAPSLLTASGQAAQATPPAVISSARQDLIVGLFGEPPQLNEFYRTEIQGSQVSYNIYNKLVRINFETREVDPELAEAWDMEDELTWVLKLREGVMWHGDWGEFTADDVVFTFNYIIDEETFQVGTALFPVESATARDTYTVEVKLKQPFAAFLPVTCDYGGIIMSRAAHEEMGPDAYGRAPVGTGPYVFDSWQSGSQIVLRKNQNYWQPDVPILDEISFRFIPDASVRLAALQNGEIDFMDHPNAVDVPEVRDTGVPGLAYHSVPGWNWDYMAFTFPPYAPEDAPWNIKEVRQAISYAIDRQTIVDEIYNGEALVSDSPIPPGFLAYRDVPIRYPRNADLARAQELMAQAGVSGFDLELITSDKEWLRREAELVSAMLSQIGINVSVQGHDAGSWVERWFGHQFQALIEDISIVAPDTDATVYWFHYPGSNSYHGWPRPDVHEMLDEARTTFEPEQRVDLYHQIVDAVQEDCPYIYLNHVNIVRLYNEQLQGLQLSNQEYVLLLHRAYWTE